jgi:predicted DNA-binding WGR domain protein
VKVAVAAVPSTTRTFEYAGGAEVRIWEVIHQGREVMQRFGAAASMLSKAQSFASVAEAESAVAELIADKVEDGFVERGLVATPKVETPLPAPARTDGRRYFEFVEGTSSKFWETWVEGTRMTARYGKIGSQGTMTIKDYPDEVGARKAMDKAIGEKVSKGYAEK